MDIRCVDGKCSGKRKRNTIESKIIMLCIYLSFDIHRTTDRFTKKYPMCYLHIMSCILFGVQLKL